MRVHFLGTGSSYPTTHRGVSATALQHDDGSVWLFDAGEGTQIQAQRTAFSRHRITKVFITHLHGDHVFGLPGLLCTISSQLGMTEDQVAERGRPRVDLYGPQGLRRFIHTTLGLSRSQLMFNYQIHELVPVAAQYSSEWGEWEVDHSPPAATHPGELPGVTITPTTDPEGNVHWPLLDDGRWVVRAGYIHHRVPSFGYVLAERDRPGTMDKAKLMALGVKPGPIYGRIKGGESVTLEDGRVIRPDMVLGPVIPGRTLVMLGDTSDASPMKHMVQKCDVVVHEATHDDNLASKALEFGHATPTQAVKFAKSVGAKTLLLNHFSQRYAPKAKENLRDGEESVRVLEDQARAAAGDALEVICAEDLFVYDLTTTTRKTIT